MNASAPPAVFPGDELSMERAPGHWILARLGKRVLRPGGLEMTERMIDALAIGPEDEVVEFAPGLGVTARRVLEARPASYTAVERDAAAARLVRSYLTGPNQRCVVGRAEDSGLASDWATVVFGEAMLTMQPPTVKARIVREACRILRPGGRYGIHEACLVPDDLDESIKHEIDAALGEALHVGARPLTAQEWRQLLAAHGFEVATEMQLPLNLLEPVRLVRDEGWWGAFCFARNLLCDRAAFRRVRAMRTVFHRYRKHLKAIMLVARKPWET